MAELEPPPAASDPAPRPGRPGLWSRFRHALGYRPIDGTEIPPAPLPPAIPEIEFTAYAEDCRLFGFLRLDAERLSDALNARDEFTIGDAIAVGLEDGRAIEAREMTVFRDELLAVRAVGPRGNPGRRARVRPYPVTLQTGPYRVHGYVHALPGADPLLHVRRRKPMVPMTEAWIEYVSVGQPQRTRVGTLIVNRELVDWIALADDEEVRLPDLPAEMKPGLLVKDFTGYIVTRGE